MLNDKELNSFFIAITETASPSGFEKKVQEIYTRFAEKYANEVYTDVNGNVIALKKGKGKLKLMITAHIDEIGFMVKYIDDQGYLWFRPIGGFDSTLLPGLGVRVMHGAETCFGIVGRKPIHLLEESERKTVNGDELWIDIGAKDKADALQKVAVGDIITLQPGIKTLGNGMFATRSADNKLGVLVLVAVLKSLKDVMPEADLYFVSSVQEEIGLRGAITSTYQIKPDLALVLDVTHATDYPSVNKNIHGDLKLGHGPVLPISPEIHPEINRRLKKAGERKGIALQYEARPIATGTEARMVQVTGRGVATGLVSIPVRYMHSPNEMFSLSDVEHTIDLVTEFCKNNHEPIV
jgi:endoglucanase